MSDIVIRAEGLGKKYIIGHKSNERVPTLRDAIMRGASNLKRTAGDIIRGRAIIGGDNLEEFWALKNVSFEIKRGDVVGIIGRNGAGKSTLLKVLSRITEPSEGCVEIRGRVASLLEVGTGFHPELTGRENIFLNGAILGMSQAEIRAKFDEIVDFAGIEKFLDTPVKRYSSGMYVRLAFAVAAHLEPEILVVDEVLAVGDAEFQKKCLGKMHDVASQGRTVLFVSHNMGAMQALCETGILLSAGRLELIGDVSVVLSAYASAGHISSSNAKCGNILLKNMTLNVFDNESTIRGSIDLSINNYDTVRELCFLIYTANGTRVAVGDMRTAISLPLGRPPGDYRISFEFKPIRLVEGSYDVGIYLVTDSFAGNLLNYSKFDVPPNKTVIAPYPVETRGIVDTDISGNFN